MASIMQDPDPLCYMNLILGFNHGAQCYEVETHTIHGNVLHTALPFFEALLEQWASENGEPKIVIPQTLAVSADVLRLLISWAYNDTVYYTDDNIHLKAPEFSTVISLYLLAHHIRCYGLQNRIMDFLDEQFLRFGMASFIQYVPTVWLITKNMAAEGPCALRELLVDHCVQAKLPNHIHQAAGYPEDFRQVVRHKILMGEQNAVDYGPNRRLPYYVSDPGTFKPTLKQPEYRRNSAVEILAAQVGLESPGVSLNLSSSELMERSAKRRLSAIATHIASPSPRARGLSRHGPSPLGPAACDVAPNVLRLAVKTSAPFTPTKPSYSKILSTPASATIPSTKGEGSVPKPVSFSAEPTSADEKRPTVPSTKVEDPVSKPVSSFAEPASAGKKRPAPPSSEVVNPVSKPISSFSEPKSADEKKPDIPSTKVEDPVSKPVSSFAEPKFAVITATASTGVSKPTFSYDEPISPSSQSVMIEAFPEYVEPVMNSLQADGPTHAMRLFDNQFPNGHSNIPISPKGDLCGLEAMVHSIEAQQPHLKPKLSLFKEIAKSKAYRKRVQATLLPEERLNQDHFTADQLGLILGLWGESRDAVLQLGYSTPASNPVLIPVENPEQATVIWIHKDDAEAEFVGGWPPVKGHWSGLKSVPAVLLKPVFGDERSTPVETKKSEIPAAKLHPSSMTDLEVSQNNLPVTKKTPIMSSVSTSPSVNPVNSTEVKTNGVPRAMPATPAKTPLTPPNNSGLLKSPAVIPLKTSSWADAVESKETPKSEQVELPQSSSQNKEPQVPDSLPLDSSAVPTTPPSKPNATNSGSHGPAFAKKGATPIQTASAAQRTTLLAQLLPIHATVCPYSLLRLNCPHGKKCALKKTCEDFMYKKGGCPKSDADCKLAHVVMGCKAAMDKFKGAVPSKCTAGGKPDHFKKIAHRGQGGTAEARVVDWKSRVASWQLMMMGAHGGSVGRDWS